MIKQLTVFLLLSVILFLFTGCPYEGYKYDQGRFPAEPVNFEAVNSEFDDYNSTSPVIESERYLYFSSNRNSQGGEFDIVGSHFRLVWDKEEGTLDIYDKPASWSYHDYRYTDTLFNLMNTGSNEYGPYSYNYYTYQEYTSAYHDLIVFANDETGNLDLKFVAFNGTGENPAPDQGSYEGPSPVSFLNSTANDAYLTFSGPNMIWMGYAYDVYNINEVVFCSDRGGNYDLYSSAVPYLSSGDILDYLRSNTGEPVIPVEILNSTYEDKCPFVEGNLLVFASDRPGGFGGFDLYFSQRNGDTWSEPLNYGDRVNTEYDEYRPIVMNNYEFVNDLMIFSSNRPGGKGGYDLYYVGIPKMIYSYY